MQELGPTYAGIFAVVSIVLGMTMNDPCETFLDYSLVVHGSAILILGMCIIWQTRLTDILKWIVFAVLTHSTAYMLWATFDVVQCSHALVKEFVIYVFVWINMVVWIIMVITYSCYYVCIEATA